MTALAPRPSPRAPRPQPVLAPLSESAVFLTLTVAGGLIFVPSQEFVDDPPPRPGSLTPRRARSWVMLASSARWPPSRAPSRSPEVTVPLPEGLLALLRRPSPCFVATVMPDGSPQLTQTWVTTDGEHVVINVVDGRQKARNIARDPRVAVNVTDPDDTARYYGVRGHVVEITTDGAAESIEEIAWKYLGRPYPNFGGGGGTRLLVTVAVDSVAHAPWD